MFTSERITLRRCLIAAAVIAALAVPVVAISVATEDTRVSIHIESSDSLFGKSMTATFNEPGRRMKARIDGQVTFTEREDDLATLEDGGEFELSETRGGVTRSLEIESTGGKLVRDYRVDGDRHDYDADARAWLAAALPDLFRRSGIDAEGRVKRIHARSGVDGVLAEIARIPSDYARATYIEMLFKHAQPNGLQVQRAIALAAEIDSDYEKRRALTLVLDRGEIDATAQSALLQAVDGIDSDYERAELLIAASEHIALDGARLEVWTTATKGISSDYEKRRVLESLLAQKDRRPEHAQLAISLAADIGSDYEKRMLLATAADAGLGSAITRSEYVQVAAGISSDYEQREALLTLIKESGAMDVPLARDVLEAARNIGSDYETKELLVAIAEVMPGEAELIAKYRSVARGLGDHERGEAERALDRFTES